MRSEIIATLRRNALPKMRTTSTIWRVDEGYVIVDRMADKTLDDLRKRFYRTTGCRMVPSLPQTWGDEESDHLLHHEFLLWLWWRIDVTDGQVLNMVDVMWIDNRMALITDAGLATSIIDVDAFALHNALQHNYPESTEGTVALVNIGHEVTNVNILDNGVPILTRDIPFGSRRVREDLQRERGLTAEEAEDVVQGRSDIPDLDAIVQQSADEVGVGIERAAAFLMTRESGEGLGRIYISGGGARIPGMEQALANRMSVETLLINPFERVPVSATAAQGIDLESAAPMLLLPLGLALRKA